MKLPEDLRKKGYMQTAECSMRDEDIVRDCAKVAGDDMRRSGKSSVVASLSTAVERAILARYGLAESPTEGEGK